MILTPWKERILIFDEVERALFDMSLRPGVRRSQVLEYSVIDFVKQGLRRCAYEACNARVGVATSTTRASSFEEDESV